MSSKARASGLSGQWEPLQVMPGDPVRWAVRVDAMPGPLVRGQVVRVDVRRRDGRVTACRVKVSWGGCGEVGALGYPVRCRSRRAAA